MALSRAGGAAFLAAWLGGGSVVLSLLMANHVIAMPDPVDLARLEGATRAHGITHIVPADCSCTDRLLESLLERPPEEHIALVGRSPRWEKRLAASGRSWHRESPRALAADYGLVSGPVLVVRGPSGLAYAGGYFAEPAAVRPRTRAILDGLTDGPVAPLPIFGCAIDRELRYRMRPWSRFTAFAASGLKRHDFFF